VTPAWRFPDELLERVRVSLDRLVVARADLRPDFIALPHVPWNGPGGHEMSGEFFAYATNPDLLDLVER
jgi:hypothetical protein